MYLVYISGELTMLLVTVWWLQRLGKDGWYVNKQHRSLM